MCEFISWVEVSKGGETHLLYLDDAAIDSDHGREYLAGTKDNDLLGHHAIRAFYGADLPERSHGELRNFWETDKLPKELREKLKDFPTMHRHFGNLLVRYAQKDDLHYILNNAPETKAWKGLKPFCAGVLAARLKARVVKLLTMVTQEELPLTLTDASLPDLIRAGNKVRKYDYVNPNITDEHFPEKASATGATTAILLGFSGETVDTEEVEGVAAELGLMLGCAKDGGHVGAQHPDRQRSNWIVCLRGDWQDPDGGRYVVVLDDSVGDRWLNLCWRGREWYGRYRFLAFRKCH